MQRGKDYEAYLYKMAIQQERMISMGYSAQVQLEGRQQIAMETWLVLEYCNQGTLSYAVERGKFDEGFIRHGRRSNKPYVPFIK